MMKSESTQTHPQSDPAKIPFTTAKETGFAVRTQPRETCCCFSGHRDLDLTKAEPIQKTVEQALRTMIERGVVHFITGGAIGFDMLAAVTVCNLKQEFRNVTLTVVIPCDAHTARWKTILRDQLHCLCRQADEIVQTAEAYYPGCMMVRNRYMVDHSGCMICFLRKGKGGTANTVAYARKQQIPIFNVAELFPDH